MSITRKVTDDLVNYIQSLIAGLGKSLSEQDSEDFEETILLLQDLNALRGSALKLRERFSSTPDSISLDPLSVPDPIERAVEVSLEDAAANVTSPIEEIEAAVPESAEASSSASNVEEAPQAPARKTRQPRQPREPKTPKQPRQQASTLVDGEYTPLQDYKPFLLRAMMKQRGSQRFVDIQKAMLKLMKQEGAAKPLDEAPVGASGVIRYVAQSAAIRKQLLTQGMITGSGAEGFRLTPAGRKYLEENFSDAKTEGSDSAETQKS